MIASVPIHAFYLELVIFYKNYMQGGTLPSWIYPNTFVHNFPTHKDDCPYLGLIHPITQFLYAYFGLPMGSANSPATSGRAGNSFMRKIREDFELFSGVGQANCFWTSFEHLGYDPALGYRFVLRN